MDELYWGLQDGLDLQPASLPYTPKYCFSTVLTLNMSPTSTARLVAQDLTIGLKKVQRLGF